jgi:hypothetical protein
MPLTISTSEWPIVHYTIEGTIDDEAEIQAYIADISGLLSRRQPYCSIIDLRRATVPSAALRRRQADWQQEHDDALRRYCRGAAFVTTSKLVKGAVMAIGWLQPWPHPVDYFTTISEARDWAAEQLKHVKPPAT